MRVTELWVHPVKSLGGVGVEQVDVEPGGLAGDRRWGLVSPTGEPVTAREVNRLLGLVARPVEGGIRLTRPDGEELHVPEPRSGVSVDVSYSRLTQAVAADREASAWLSEHADRDLRLVWQPDPTARPINPQRGGRPGEALSLADAGPVLLCSESSLAQLRGWMGPDDATMQMRRFRPNIVIDGDVPFAEDAWPRVRIGEVLFRTTMVCDRCVMTTIDPVTLARGKEPIRTLARHRRWDGQTWFGTRLVAESSEGRIAVDDPVEPC